MLIVELGDEGIGSDYTIINRCKSLPAPAFLISFLVVMLQLDY